MDTFDKILDPHDSTTGGGSASAIAGAMAGALAAMVARLSTSDQDSADSTYFRHVYNQTDQLSHELLDGSTQDSLAFQAVRSAYQLPRQTDAEKDYRLREIQAAWTKAATVPLENASHCLKLIHLCSEMADRVNPKVRSDLTCALLLARAGLLGCLENVQINLPSIKDEGIHATINAQIDTLRSQLTQFDHVPLP